MSGSGVFSPVYREGDTIRPGAAVSDTGEVLAYYSSAAQQIRHAHLYILEGQSNAAGRAAVADLAAENSTLAAAFGGIVYGNLETPSDGTTVYEQPLGDWQTKGPAGALGEFGPDISLARCLSESPPADFNPQLDCIVLLKMAAGGSSIGSWIQGGPVEPVWTSWLQNRIAELQASAFCKQLICERLFSVRGESEAVTGFSGADYVARFQVYLDLIESTTGCVFEPVFSQIKTDGSTIAGAAGNTAAEINEAMAAVYANTGSNDDLALLDGIHYDADSLVELGSRLCTA